MAMKERLFRFKQFSVRHELSAMKVGMDGVLLGTWAAVDGARRILDAGCGCGLIALMCAQRNAGARIDAIDVHALSVEEASFNFAASPWSGRLDASVCDFMKWRKTGYDVIISNPPFFKSGLEVPVTDRETARHSAALSPEALLRHGAGLLSEKGRISLVATPEWEADLASVCVSYGLAVTRLCRVRGSESGYVKRVLMEFSPAACGRYSETELSVESAPGIYTEAYKTLTEEFYLNF